MTTSWLVPTMGYVLAVGALGVSSKLALRTLSWQGLIVWMGAGYAIVLVVLLALGELALILVGDTWWAIASASLAIGGLVVLYVALGTGEASKVVPVSAAYPMVTVVLSALVLSESLTVARVGGMALVVGGVVLITIAR